MATLVVEEEDRRGCSLREDHQKMQNLLLEGKAKRRPTVDNTAVLGKAGSSLDA